MKSFEYQIAIKVLLCKYKADENIVYFNSANGEILYRINNWVNKGFGWITESIQAQYVNILIYSPLSESTYIELPGKLKDPMKGLIDVKSNDNKCFLWCHLDI